MRAMFVADGPFSSALKTQASNAQGASEGTPDAQNAPFIMEGFDNVEVYGLVAKLLGIKGAPNNGTVGFWDRFLDD